MPPVLIDSNKAMSSSWQVIVWVGDCVSSPNFEWTARREPSMWGNMDKLRGRRSWDYVQFMSYRVISSRIHLLIFRIYHATTRPREWT